MPAKSASRPPNFFSAPQTVNAEQAICRYNSAAPTPASFSSVFQIAKRRFGKQFFRLPAGERNARLFAVERAERLRRPLQDGVHEIARIQRPHRALNARHEAQSALGKILVRTGKIALDERGRDLVPLAEHNFRGVGDKIPVRLCVQKRIDVLAFVFQY